MKCLTLTQPWATLVAIGAKQYETRSWGTSYRGPLAIHAAKGMPGYAVDACHERPFSEALAGEPHAEALPRGQVIAIVSLTSCLRTEAFLKVPSSIASAQELAFGDFSNGRYAWKLDRPAPIVPPEPAVGHLGLWEWEPSQIVRLWLEEHYPEAVGA